jgi:hypothetical protein
MLRRTRSARPLQLLVLGAAAALLVLPDAHALEGHCVKFCDTPDYPPASAGGSYADAMAYDLAGQLVGQAAQAAAAGFAAAIEQALAEEARRNAARQAARSELLARRKAELDARNAERAQREQAHQQALADAGLRMESIIGDLMSQLGGPATRFSNFQFAGVTTAAPHPNVHIKASDELRFDRGTQHSAPVDLRGASVTRERAIDPAEMKRGTPFAYGLEEKARIRERWDRMASENLERLRGETALHEARQAAEDELWREAQQRQIGEALVESALEDWQGSFR